MSEELSLREIINLVILFFIKFKLLIISITFIGFLSMIIFEKNKPEYFSTIAIATSGISEFERIYDSKEEMNQRTAINMINNLQLDVRKEDYNALSSKLDISEYQASMIKFIEAEQIFREDQDEKKHNTPKFSIHLLVRNKSSILIIQEGLLTYFNTNKYISDYKMIFNTTNSQIISSIDKEIDELRVTLRDDYDIVMENFFESITSSVEEVMFKGLKIFVGIASISLVVSGILIGLVIYTSILERIKEIGILTAVGAKQSNIIGIFLMESAMIGLLASLIATGVGLLLTRMINGLFSNFIEKCIICYKYRRKERAKSK